MMSSAVRILGCGRRSGTASSLIAPPFHRSTRPACGSGLSRRSVMFASPGRVRSSCLRSLSVVVGAAQTAPRSSPRARIAARSSPNALPAVVGPRLAGTRGGGAQGVRAVGEGFVERAAGAEALEGGGEAAAGLAHPVLADGPGGHGGLLAEDEVRPGGAWPPVAAVLEPGEEQVPGQVIQRAGLAADDQPPAAGIDVGQVELADCPGPGRLDGGQGEREAGGGGDGGGPSLVYLAGLEEAQGPQAVVDGAGGVAED